MEAYHFFQLIQFIFQQFRFALLFACLLFVFALRFYLFEVAGLKIFFDRSAHFNLGGFGVRENILATAFALVGRQYFGVFEDFGLAFGVGLFRNGFF
jgi:hypothetical protein